MLSAESLGNAPATLRVERGLSGGESGDRPRIDRAQLARMVELGAQQFDHAIAEVAILVAAAIPKRQNGDARGPGGDLRARPRGLKVPDGPHGKQDDRRRQDDERPPAWSCGPPDSDLQRRRHGHDRRERLARVR